MISVHGVVFAHDSVEDRAAEAYATITLWESGYATQTQIARAEDEGRTPIQTVPQSTATLEPTDQELRVTLSPLSSPHRSQAVAALCENLNTAETRFPGTDLRMRFAVAGYPQ